MKSKVIFHSSGLAAALTLLASGASAQITSETLRPVDPFDVGALGAGDGALPESLWRGSNAATARAAISRAPAPSQSAAVNRLVGRALLSGGSPPEGAEGDEELAALRLQTAWRAGFSGDVAQIGQRTPDIEAAPALSRLKADADLMLGELDQACRTAERLKQGRDEAYWLQLRAVCLARANDPAARLTEDLARSAGADEDFETAMALAYGDEVEEVEPSNPLILGLALNSDTTIHLKLDEMAPPVLTALTLGKGPENIKPVLARKAAGLGLISAGELAAIYRTVEPPETVGVAADLMAAAMNASGEMKQGLLFRAAESVRDPAMKADIVAEALNGAKSASGYMLTARLYAPILKQLERSPDHALAFAQAAAAAGDPALAKLWRDRATTPPPPPPPASLGAPLDSDSDGSPDPVSLSAPLNTPDFDPPSDAALARLNALIDLYPSSRAELAVERRMEAGGANDGFEAMMLSATGGEPLSADMRAAFLDSGAEGSGGALVLTLNAAAEAGAKAETALLAASLLGDGGPAGAADADLYSAVAALRRAGLNDSAAELAAEAILARRR